jgi:hypothetical protein
MSTQPVEHLEHRAKQQRLQMHLMTAELKGKISEAKERLDIRRNLREHLFAVCVALGAAALLIGTVIARRFERKATQEETSWRF